jgi:DNA-binding IclR family transcriptional regulator
VKNYDIVFQIMNTPEKVVALLDELASAGSPCGVSELGRLLGIDKNNVMRIVAALETKGWIMQNPTTKKYSLTGAIVEVAFRGFSKQDIYKLSLPHLHELQAATGESCSLAVRIELERMFINCVSGEQEIHRYVVLGKRMPLWSGAIGKCMLAFLSEEEIETVLRRFQNSGVSAVAEGRVLTVESLREELAEIKQQGFAVGYGERTSTCNISAPIFAQNQKVVGAIGVSGPLPRFHLDKAYQFSTLILQKAQEISAELKSPAP